MDKDDNQVDFTDLPSLPPNEIRILGHIIRNQGARRSEILHAFSGLPEGESIGTDELDQILAELVQKRLLSTSKSEGETTYSPRIRRKTSQVRTLQGIWNALDSGEDGEPLESEIHSEIRKARSDIANNLLADMSDLDQISTEAAPTTDEARKTGESLLSDLTLAGRSSMSKRENIDPKPEKKREAKGRTLQADIAGSKSDRVLDDLAATLKKQTGIHPVVRDEPEKTSLWRKLLSWLGRD